MCAADFDYFLELNFLRIYLLESNVSIFENRKKYEITPAFCALYSLLSGPMRSITNLLLLSCFIPGPVIASFQYKQIANSGLV